MVPGGFEDAKAARAEIVGKLSRAEPVRRTKVAFGEFSEAIFRGMSGRPRTLQKHRYHLDKHLLPRFRNRMIGEISTDDVARLIAEMQRGVHFVKVDGRLVRERRESGYAGWTTSGVVSTLGLILGKAKRRGLIPANPVNDLERGERPKLAQAEKRVLDNAQIAKLLSEAGSFRPLVAVLIFSGLRLGEALGLQWRDVDDGFLHVRRQLGRDRLPAEIKTAAGRREVVLMPQLASVLTTHRVASRYSQGADYVFLAPPAEDATTAVPLKASRGL